jgi:hypothetical protein
MDCKQKLQQIVCKGESIAKSEPKSMNFSLTRKSERLFRCHTGLSELIVLDVNSHPLGKRCMDFQNLGAIGTANLLHQRNHWSSAITIKITQHYVETISLGNVSLLRHLDIIQFKLPECDKEMRDLNANVKSE